MRQDHSIFLDPSGRRWRAIRRATVAIGVLTTLVGLGLVITFLIPPILPKLQAAKKAVNITQPKRTIASTRLAAQQAAARAQMTAALTRSAPPKSIRAERLPVIKNRAVETIPATKKVAPNSQRPGIVAGFYVDWQDNSFASFSAHAKDLDWVICECAFITAGGDSLNLRLDSKVPYFADQLPEKDRPRVFMMVSNVDYGTGVFDAKRVRKLLASAESRQRGAMQLVRAAQKFGLAGITVDFEEVPDDLHGEMVLFLATLRDGLHPGGRLLTMAVSVSADSTQIRDYANVNDYLFLMLYDEHYNNGDPGPVASQGWFTAKTKQMLSWMPPSKAILALGAYGYHWDDHTGKLTGAQSTFQETMQHARQNNASIQFDPLSLNPYIRWSDPDHVDHVIWFLDGVTAWNQWRAGNQLHAAGVAIWRLGDEDPSLWSALSNDVDKAQPSVLEPIPPGYDVQFDGIGEILRVTHRPGAGVRVLSTDSTSGLITHEQITQIPSPWVVQRFGASDSTKIALTFDDGPDAKYTNDILDTLLSRNVKATFFVIGRQADEYPGILRRIVREGHEVGNHTYTHPNLALTNPFVARLEVVANGRLIETIINRRTSLFRPPYFGDASPTTADELVPVGMASDLGYLTVGVRIDSDDWRSTNKDSILQHTLDRAYDGNVVLLHDSGGDRRGTVAILGVLIDSLRARGLTLVLVSDLAGITRDEIMPAIASRTAFEHVADIIAFTFIGLLDWGLYWIFLVAVVLAIGRLLFIISLATVQRFLKKKESPGPAFTPPVSIVVPAYREERVIVHTVKSLLAQTYTGPMEIIIVDDGSPDATYDEAMRAFGNEPRVMVLTKPNGGKASALNYGIASAQHEIIIALDADTQFEPQTVGELVKPLANPSVGAVAGNAKVGNRINLVTRWQALEYVTSQNLDRRAFALLDCITVIPGAVGAWRRTAVLEAGGFTTDTLAEDQDLTIRIRKLNHSIGFAERAIAWTEAPATLSELSKQRFRWSFGTLQCAWKHKHALFNPKYGTLGFVALPNTWLFQLILTALSPLADLMFVWGLLSVWLTFKSHGRNYALTDLEQIMLFYAIFLVTDWLAALVAFMMEPDEERALTWLIVLQRFAYRQIMYSVVVRSFVAAIRGRVVGWGRLDRKATVELPA